MTIITPRVFFLASTLLSGSFLLASTSPASAQPRPDRTPQGDRSNGRSTRPNSPDRPGVLNTPRPANGSGSYTRPNSTNNSGAYNRPNSSNRPVSTNGSGSYNRPGSNNGSGSTNRPGFNNRPNSSNRPGSYNSPVYGGGTRGNYGRTYTGQVTNVRSSQSFDINIGGNTFNVYTTSRVPRGLSRGDIVRVDGQQMYTNDIRNASATVIRNR